MQCPYCQETKTSTLDSRQTGDRRRRRRHCEKCDRRFSTEETLFEKLPMVTKVDGKTEEFNETKLQQSLQLALRKRNMSGTSIDGLVDKIKGMLYLRGEPDVGSKFIGQSVMAVLKQLDWVAYIRYASVYRAFNDMDDFVEEIRELKRDLTPEQRSLQMSLLEVEHQTPKRRRARRANS